MGDILYPPREKMNDFKDGERWDPAFSKLKIVQATPVENYSSPQHNSPSICLPSCESAQIEPFHRVFRRPLSALRGDKYPFVAPTVFARASDGQRPPHKALQPLKPTASSSDGGGTAASGGTKGGGAGGGWTKRGLAFAGSGGLGIAGGADLAVKKGVRAGMAKFRKGRGKSSVSGANTAKRGGAAAEVMSGVGVDSSGPQTVREEYGVVLSRVSCYYCDFSCVRVWCIVLVWRGWAGLAGEFSSFELFCGELRHM